MQVVQHNPRQFFEQLRKEMDQMLGLAQDDPSNVVTSRWAPAVDIKEDEHQFTLVADLPGIDPKDIEITMERGILSIKGERKHEAVTEQRGYQRIERAYGVFHRRFTLPDSANADDIRAEGKNGVLTLTIPKQPKSQPKRINVHG